MFARGSICLSLSLFDKCGGMRRCRMSPNTTEKVNMVSALPLVLLLLTA